MCVGKIEIVLEIVGESCVWPGCPGFTTTLTTLTSSQEVNAMLYNLTLSDRCQRFDNLIKMIFQSLIGIFRHGRKTSCWGNSGSNICLYHWPAVPQPEKRRQVESYQLHSKQDYIQFFRLHSYVGGQIFKTLVCNVTICIRITLSTQVLVRERGSPGSFQSRSAPRD